MHDLGEGLQSQLTDDAAEHAAIEILGRVRLDLPKGKLAFGLDQGHDEEWRGEEE